MADSSMRERFGQLLASAGKMYWELARDYTVTYANSLMEDVFGDPVGKKCFEFMAHDDHPCSDCPVRKVYAGTERADSERSRITKDGRRIWHQHTATPIKNSEGVIIGACELIVETTNRREFEERIKHSEQLYRNLVEQVPDVIFALDADGHFVFVNTQIERFLGFTVKEVLDTSFKNYIAEEDRAQADSMFNLKPGETWDEEVGVVDKDNNRKFARIRCTGSFENGEKPSGFEGVMRDRTVRRKLEEELRASRQALVEKIGIIDELYEHIVQSGKCKAIEEHTAEVAHELRQPLAIIGGFARRMGKMLESEEAPDKAKQNDYLQIIISEIQRLEKILDGLIDFTRREQICLQKINPHDLIDYIVGIIQTRASEKRIQIHINYGAEIGEIPADPGRFQQLVLNIMANAIDASPYGGTIEIQTGASIPSDKAMRTGELDSPLYFEMKVRNEGPTIPENDIQQIFNPFYTTKEHGTGLGLTVTKKIVEDHSGSISVKSEDNGTTFTIWLPLERPKERRGPQYMLTGESSKN